MDCSNKEYDEGLTDILLSLGNLFERANIIRTVSNGNITSSALMLSIYVLGTNETVGYVFNDSRIEIFKSFFEVPLDRIPTKMRVCDYDLRYASNKNTCMYIEQLIYRHRLENGL
jgi:hypothetical protein